MEKEILSFLEKENLRLFERTNKKIEINKSFKTKEAKLIAQKTLNFLYCNFYFENTKNLFNFFINENYVEKIKNKQEFFKSIKKENRDFLIKLKKPKPFWYPKYEVLVVTEDEETFLKLQDLDCPVSLINSERDLADLEKYDVIQVIGCENFSEILERLPQAVFSDSIEDIYLERHLSFLSGWKENLEIIIKECDNEKIKKMAEELFSLISLLGEEKEEIKKEVLEEECDKINEKILSELKNQTISGEKLVSLLTKRLPEEIKTKIEKEIKEKNLPEDIFEIGLPLKINYEELEKYIKRKNQKKFSDFVAKLQKNAEKIKNIKKNILELEKNLLLFDFCSALYNYIEGKNYPIFADFLSIKNSKNIFLDNPQPISFELKDKRGSVLTGANSGGKTTLLEHLIQVIFVSQIGLPVSGEVNIPLFEQVYYFAKNKGSPTRGAFENLLMQMASIKPEGKTIILADEIEALTEPGVAGEIIASTMKYFLERDCFCVFATHLGKEILQILPEKARIDGIEAKGLDENFNLIVDHNPILGRLANSTPELIIEKLAKTSNENYFRFVWENLKKNKS
ncbi:MAG: hypothetical protein QW103_01190 [Candidatus Pacearchaeota archaeon]